MVTALRTGQVEPGILMLVEDQRPSLTSISLRYRAYIQRRPLV